MSGGLEIGDWLTPPSGRSVGVLTNQGMWESWGWIILNLSDEVQLGFAPGYIVKWWRSGDLHKRYGPAAIWQDNGESEGWIDGEFQWQSDRKL